MTEIGEHDSERVGWNGRVAFSDRFGIAYRPGEVLVHQSGAEAARELLRQDSEPRLEPQPRGSFLRMLDVPEPMRAVAELRRQGIDAHLNNVMFSHGMCCCRPHPAMLWANPFSSNAFWANPFSSNAFGANPFSSNPFSSNPFSSNPFLWVDYQPHPLYVPVHAKHRPETAEFRRSGRRSHSAHPVNAPDLPPLRGDHERKPPSIVVVDTGIAGDRYRPDTLAGVRGVNGVESYEENPDEDEDGRIDPVAGHGTFIAGIIDRIVPRSELTVLGLLSGYGDASETDLVDTLESLDQDSAPDLVNLSFGGYALTEMAALGEAVHKLQKRGTVVVASAGNDSTCRPAYPAALPDVVSVGALGPYGPAPFTNYGSWVRACAPGVDVVSTFFKNWPPKRPGMDEEYTNRPPKRPGMDEEYDGWARWSGTSFAAPAVVGALARAIRDGFTRAQAVERLIDDPGVFHIPDLGAVVNQVPWWGEAMEGTPA